MPTKNTPMLSYLYRAPKFTLGPQVHRDIHMIQMLAFVFCPRNDGGKHCAPQVVYGVVFCSLQIKTSGGGQGIARRDEKTQTRFLMYVMVGLREGNSK